MPIARKITKAIAYAYATSTAATELGFADTGCYYVQQTLWGVEGSDQIRTARPHDAEGFRDPADPDLIAYYFETAGAPDSAFLRYGNRKALDAIDAYAFARIGEAMQAM